MANEFKKELDLTSVIMASVEATKKQLHQLELLKRKVKAVGEQNIKIKKTFADVQPAMDKILGKTPLGIISRINNNMRSFNKSMGELGGKAGFAKSLNLFFKDLSGNVKLFSKNLGTAVGGGMRGMLKNFGLVVKTLGVGFKGLLASLSGLLLPITLIVAAVFTLKRMWKLNIGGMQTTFFKFVGTLKEMWGKFNVMFNKLLMKLSPIFKAIFGVLEAIIIPQLKWTWALIEGIFTVLEPVFDIFSEIGKAVSELISPLTKSSNQFDGILGIIKGIFKAISVVVKILLFPLKIGFKILGVFFKIRNAIRDGITRRITEWIKGSKTIQKIFSFIKTIIDGIKATIEFIINPIREMVGFLEGIGETKAPAGAAAIPVSPEEAAARVTTNNTRNTFNNNLTVQTSGNVTPESAPVLMDGLSRQMQTKARI